MDSHKKILFRYYSNVLDEITVETMWGEIINDGRGIYKLDSIPFYGAPIAPGDEFLAEYDSDEEMLTFRNVTQESGNSVVLIIIINDGIEIEKLRNEFKALNCVSEGVSPSYFSMEILKETDYSVIGKILEDYSTKGILDFAEPCLSEKHKNDTK